MLAWSQSRRYEHEQRLQKETNKMRIHEIDRRRGQTPRERPKAVVSDLALFHEDEYVDYLKERREMRASQPQDRGKWKCMGTELVHGADHASIHIAAHTDAPYAIERQFWTWCGREITLEKLVVQSPPPAFDDSLFHEEEGHAVDIWTAPGKHEAPIEDKKEAVQPKEPKETLPAASKDAKEPSGASKDVEELPPVTSTEAAAPTHEKPKEATS
ncbi:hypothetical protein AC1031_002490 [Aphanomyces cochlioides]|nr:hypothetical protein AC1031_002490 [Aphanomyces cochlioides]